MYMATVIISPCAKFTTRTTPKMTDNPSAIRPYTSPVSRPLTVTFKKILAGTGGGPAKGRSGARAGAREHTPDQARLSYGVKGQTTLALAAGIGATVTSLPPR